MRRMSLSVSCLSTAEDMSVVSNSSFFGIGLYPPEISMYFSNRSCCFFARPIMCSASLVLLM